MPNKTRGFYGGTVEFDGRGYHVKLHDNAGEIYFERNEIQSFVSLMWKILFAKKKKNG